MKDLLSTARAPEINWDHVQPMLAGCPLAGAQFVYFMAESDGPVKIGWAVNPIKRLRILQTGNPRRLKIERLIHGTRETEALLHEYWRPHAIGGNPRRSSVNPIYKIETEWFKAEVRDEILDAASRIADEQQLCDEITDPIAIVPLVMTELGYEVTRAAPVHLLAKGAGYVDIPMRP